MGRIAVITLAVVVATVGAARAELVTPLVPTPAAPDEARAQEAYDKASRLAQRRHYTTALRHAKESLELAPSAQRAALVGAIAVELGHGREAFEALLVAVTLDRPERKLDDYVEKRLAALPSLGPTDLGILRLTVVAPSRVSCALADTGERFDLGDGGGAVGIPAGHQVVSCGADGFEAQRLEVDVPARAVVDASVRLVPVQITPEPPPPPPPDDGVDPVALGLVIGGGALIAGGVGLHLWALDAKSEGDAARERAVEDYDAARADYAAASDALGLRRALTFGAYGVGAALLGTGLVLLVTDDDDEAPAVTLVPSFGADHLGAVCGFDF